MTNSVSAKADFSALGLSAPVLAALQDVGYESPSPIQAQTIPVVLSGSDLLGQAQTGTGKTAAFALPILTQLDLSAKHPQALVMAPTRELAIQVAEAFRKYASHMPGFQVLPIYGGQSYTPQLNALKRGVQVVVGTPGRILDHLDRGTLSLKGVKQVVLDEADEMLQMGFVDAMDAILSKVPPQRQVILYSATMAPAIQRIAEKQMREPKLIAIKAATTTAANIRQRYWLISGVHKLDALTRILEVESFDAMLVFARTKQSTVELSEKLEARGFRAAALNGDILQAQRERTINALKSGTIDIVVATDVAARGLDVERITHVINFDIPHDSESYIHRIGRTGRAGRKGEAILFVAPRERNMLKIIERATRQPIEPMPTPTLTDVNQARVQKFKDRLTEALALGGFEEYRSIIEDFVTASGVDIIDIAAVLSKLIQGKASLLIKSKAGDSAGADNALVERGQTGSDEPRGLWRESEEDGKARRKSKRTKDFDEQQASYRLSVGRVHNITAGNIVGLLANKADLAGHQINGVDIQKDHTLVRLPADLSPRLVAKLAAIQWKGQPLQLKRLKADELVSAQRHSKERFQKPKKPAHRGKAPSKGRR